MILNRKCLSISGMCTTSNRFVCLSSAHDTTVDSPPPLPPSAPLSKSCVYKILRIPTRLAILTVCSKQDSIQCSIQTSCNSWWWIGVNARNTGFLGVVRFLPASLSKPDNPNTFSNVSTNVRKKYWMSETHPQAIYHKQCFKHVTCVQCLLKVNNIK